MREIHGVVDATACDAVLPGNRRVSVADGDEFVVLWVSTADSGAALTPESARFIAKLLVESADRVASSQVHGSATQNPDGGAG